MRQHKKKILENDWEEIVKKTEIIYAIFLNEIKFSFIYFVFII